MRRLDVIKKLALNNIHMILSSLGLEYRDRYHSLTMPCPIHGSSRHDSFSFHIEKGIWKCFSRGCDKEYGSDIFGLVRALRGYSFSEAVNYIERFIDSNITSHDIKKFEEDKSNRDFISANKPNNNCNVYPEEVLKRLSYNSYLERRGYPKELIEEYHIGVGKSGRYMSDRIIFPIRNLYGHIVGFTGRTLFDDWKERKIPKWLHSRDLEASKNLFNIDRAAEHIEKCEQAILVEGPLDVLRLEQCGVLNSVAVFGKKLYKDQMDILYKAGTLKLIIAFDNDSGGESGKRDVLTSTNGLFDIEIAKLPKHKNDVGDMNCNDIAVVFGGVNEKAMV